jgi:hypothetical protein
MGIVVHAYNPSYVEGIVRRIVYQGLPGKKVQDSISKNNKNKRRLGA